MKKFITLFSIALAFSFAAQAQLQLASGTPEIDGYVDDDVWGDTWVSQDSIKGTGTDMSSHFQIANDADNIYLVVEVTDATPNNNPADIANSYERDCIELFFSMKSSDFETVDYGSGDWQIRVQREAELADENPYIDGSENATAAIDDIEFEVVADPNGYVIEIGLSMDMLAEDSDFDGANFRFDIAAADNDGTGRVQQSFWAGASDNQWKDTGVFGDCALATVGVNDRAAETLNAYVSGNEVVVSNVSGLVSIYNVAGQLVVSQEIEGKGAINISSLNEGLYIVENNNVSKKIMK